MALPFSMPARWAGLQGLAELLDMARRLAGVWLLPTSLAAQGALL